MQTYRSSVPAEGSHLAFSPDGRYLAAGGYGSLEVVDLTADRTLAGPALDTTGSPDAVWFTPDGRLLGSAGYNTHDYGSAFDGTVPFRVRDRLAGHLLGSSTDHRYGLLSVGTAETLMLRFMAFATPRRVVWEVAIPSAANTAAAISPDAARVVCVRWNHWLLERSPATGDVIREYPPPAMLHQLAFTPDGSRLVGRTRSGSPLVWDDADLSRKPRLASAKVKRSVNDMALHPDSTHALVATNDGPVVVCDLAAKRAGPRYDWQIGATGSVAVSPDGCRAATLGESGRLVVWDLDL